MDDPKKKPQMPKKGEAAKLRLLQTALDIFGEHGFNAATTRMIARKAGVNIAAIRYYFGGKKDLYNAVVDYVAGHLATYMRSTLLEIEAGVADQGLSPGTAMDLLEKLLGKMCDFIVGSQDAARFARIILREHLVPSSAYDIIFSRIMSPFLSAGSHMIAVISGKPPGRETSLRAFALFGQIMAFRIARETVVRALGFEGYSAKETEEIRRIILEQARAALNHRQP